MADVARVEDFRRVRARTLLFFFDDLDGGFDSVVDPRVVPAVVRRLVRKAVVSLVVGVVLLAVYVGSLVVFTAVDDAFAASGEQVTGEIVEFQHGRMSVRYDVRGAEYVEPVDLGLHADRYQLGQYVVVIYDPERPSRMMTTLENNTPGWRLAIYVFLLALAAGFGFVGGQQIVSWVRRAGTLRAPDWRHGRVSVGPAYAEPSELNKSCPWQRARRRTPSTGGGYSFLHGPVGSRGVGGRRAV
jgi:hypothetical protein